jgi:hypothetical protein
VILVSDYAFAIRERDLIARSTVHRRRLANNKTPLPVCRENFFADLQVSLTFPAGRRRDRRVYGKSLALFFGQFDVPNTMLPRAVWVESSEQLSHDVVLPRQKRERLACVLTLAVPQDLLEEMHHPLVLSLALFAEVRHRGA